MLGKRGRELKIRVSAVRFCPWPPFQIRALVENDTDVKCPIFLDTPTLLARVRLLDRKRSNRPQSAR